MDNTAIAEAADLLAANRLNHNGFEGFPADCAPQSEADGYTIQSALRDRLIPELGPVRGYKVGCTSKVMQDYMRIDHPCSGHVFASTVHRGETALPVSTWHHVGVELEIAVELATALEACGAPHSRASVAGAVGACMAAIELVDDRYADFRKLDTPTLIADDFFGAGCVLGETVQDWRRLDLATLAGELVVNGESAGRGVGAAALGHPLESLAQFANEASARGETLPAGAIVLTGSIVQTRWLEAGDIVLARVQGLGDASLTVTHD